jgi:hypothetical protein
MYVPSATCRAEQRQKVLTDLNDLAACHIGQSASTGTLATCIRPGRNARAGVSGLLGKVHFEKYTKLVSHFIMRHC